MTGAEDVRNLVSRLRTGDATAADEVVRRFGGVVRSQVRVWLRMQDPRLRRLFDSLDVCQSAFGSFFAGVAAGRFDLSEPGQLAALLLQMARHKFYRQVRRHRAGRRDVRRLDPTAEVEGPVRNGSPSTVVAGQEMLAELRKRLTDEERRIADLRADGRAWSDVAAELGGSPQARRMQLARAVDRVAAELGLEDRA